MHLLIKNLFAKLLLVIKLSYDLKSTLVRDLYNVYKYSHIYMYITVDIFFIERRILKGLHLMRIKYTLVFI